MSEEEYVGALVFDYGTAIPSIDMGQPIVRCRDCRWFLKDRVYGDACRWFCRINRDPDGFCKWGERKVDA